MAKFVVTDKDGNKKKSISCQIWIDGDTGELKIHVAPKEAEWLNKEGFEVDND